MGGGDFLAQLTAAGQREPLVVARGESVQSSEIRALTEKTIHCGGGPRHLVYEFPQRFLRSRHASFLQLQGGLNLPNR